MLTDEGKINQVLAVLNPDYEICYAYGYSYCRVKEEIREELKVGDIDEYFHLLLKSFKVKETDNNYDMVQTQLEEFTDNKLGMWITHCLAGSFYVEQEKVVRERAEQWFNTRSAYFDGEEAAIGIALKKKKARTVFLENEEENDDWSEDE